MLSFIESSLMIMCSDSSSSRSLIFPSDLGIDCSISLPLLKVIMAWTSSIFGADSLRKLSSCTPPRIGQCLGKGISLFPALVADWFRLLMMTAWYQFFDLGFYEAHQSFLSMELSTFSIVWFI